MQEIEAKVLEVDPGEVEEKLEELGAEKVFEGEVVSRFYEASGMDEGDVLRLRKAGDKYFVTLKEKVDHDMDSKVLEETEFYVSDFESAKRVLGKLGEPVEEFSKHRTRWERGEVEYVVDRYEGIPPLLEIEAPTEKQVRSAFEELGYAWEDAVDWDAREVFEQYEK